jgi:hypothetical protein
MHFKARITKKKKEKEGSLKKKGGVFDIVSLIYMIWFSLLLLPFSLGPRVLFILFLLLLLLY